VRPIRGRPTEDSTTDKALADIHDAAKLPVEISPDQAPALKAICIATLAALRATRGDADGQLGPRSCILSGTSEALDGGEGMYVWDQTSTATDDGVDVVEVAGVKVGRWRRLRTGVDDGDKGDITVSGDGSVWNIDANAVGTAEIADDAVTNAKMANMAQSTIKGRAAGAGTGDPTDLSVSQALTILGALAGVTLQAFTGSGTYTPTSGMKHCLVFSTGGGGGSGGAVTAATTNDCAVAAGGAAGGTCIEAFSAATIGASQTVTIGAAGSAGAAGTGGNGGNGGNTTFGSLHTATGGAGGNGSGVASVQNQDVAGSAGGVPTGGLANLTGGDGGGGSGFVGAGSDPWAAHGGNGGASFWGGGARGGTASGAGSSAVDSAAGVAGAAYGAGAGGACAVNDTTGVAGAVGAAGYCLVVEFT
jgi:hypothetical protein